ncbi:hypothetical protein [Halalkalicoccus ordinarius]|uniref:hypothetical protein n=1 Tax=Halalkalicoccus ordinarius TaxID=3116651 RepID=UPI00300F1CDE
MTITDDLERLEAVAILRPVSPDDAVDLPGTEPFERAIGLVSGTTVSASSSRSRRTPAVSARPDSST